MIARCVRTFAVLRCSECGKQFHSKTDRLFCVWQCKQKATEEAQERVFRALDDDMGVQTDGNPCHPLVLSDVSTHPQVSTSTETPLIVRSSASPQPHNHFDRPTVAPLIFHSNDFTTAVPSPTATEATDSAPNSYADVAPPQSSSSDSCQQSRLTGSTPAATTPTLCSSSTAASLETSLKSQSTGSRTITSPEMVTDPNGILGSATPLGTSITTHVSASLFPHVGPLLWETEASLLVGPCPLFQSPLALSVNTSSQSQGASSSSVSSRSSMTTSAEDVLTRIPVASQQVAPSLSLPSEVVFQTSTATSNDMAPHLATSRSSKCESVEASAKQSDADAAGAVSSSSSLSKPFSAKAAQNPSTESRGGNSKQGTSKSVLTD